MREEGLKEELALLWGAYEFLQEHDLSGVSSTSRLLRGGEVDYLRDRLAQEMLELAGVITGEHRHNGLPQDVILEGSQVCYWLYLFALSEGISFAQLRPDVHLAKQDGSKPSASLITEGFKATDQALQGQQDEMLPTFQAILGLVGKCLALFEIDPSDLVGYDLAQMRKRPYMDAYFANRGNG